MENREKVKKGLQAHAEGCGYRSNYCDFMECPYRIGDISCDIEQMCIDALALLKQKPETCKNCSYHRHDGWCDELHRETGDNDYCSFGAWKGDDDA